MRKITIQADAPLLRVDFREFYEFRWVFWMLIVRDIKLRYKQTLLGVAWVVLQPLITALLFTAVFGRVMKLGSEGVPYIVFAFIGLVPWLFFSQSVQRASTCLTGDRRLITKVYFPRMFVPLSATFGVTIDFFIALTMAFILMSVKGIAPTAQLAFLPVCAFILYLFTSGVCLLLSGFNVYYRDLKHTLPFIMQLWMYASPLVYSANIIPEKFRFLYHLNPIAGIVEAFRWSLLGQGSFPHTSFSLSCGISVLALLLGLFYFRKIEHYFADVI